MQLTLIATVFRPPTFITGFFGQHAAWMEGHTDSLAMFPVFGIGALYGWCRRGGYVQR